MKLRIIELRNKSVAKARQAMKRINAFRIKHSITRTIKKTSLIYISFLIAYVFNFHCEINKTIFWEKHAKNMF